MASTDKGVAASDIYTADVIVLGGGGSGLAAAISARTHGRDVILLEKNPILGGSAGRSIGSMSATATPHQIRKGIKDSPDEHFNDLGEFNAKAGKSSMDNLVLRRILVDNMNDTLRWLMSLGVRFFGPMIEPPHRKSRMHNVLPSSRSFIYHLEKHARAIGVDIRCDRRGTELVVEGNRVLGLDCSTPDGRIERYLARGGVVLTTGDFSASAELKARFGSAAVAKISPINPTNTGDGHLMAMKIGARVLNGNVVNAGIRFVPPPRKKLVQLLPPWTPVTACMEFALENLPAWMIRPFIMSFLTTVLGLTDKLFDQGAMLVNKQGERFCDEFAKPVYKLAEQPEQSGFVIFDARLAERFTAYPYFISTAGGIAYAYLPDYQRSRPEVFAKADTLAALALKIGASPDALAAAVAQHNNAIKEGRQSPSGKPLTPIENGPFYSLGPVRSYVASSDGGLAINERFQVLGPDDKPFEGLYAAGIMGLSGMLLKGHGHHLGWAFTSGRMAGRNAAYCVRTPNEN